MSFIVLSIYSVRKIWRRCKAKGVKVHMKRNSYKRIKNYRCLLRHVYADNELIEKNRKCKCLVILHLFYDESWIEISEYLRNLSDYQFDLIITATEGKIQESTKKSIISEYPNVKYTTCENRGWDLLPFFRILQDIDLNEYDVVFKIHSKSTKRPYIYIYKQLFLRRDWFLNLFEGILSAKNVHRTIDVLYNSDNVGLIAAKNLIVKDPKHKLDLINSIAKEKKIDIIDDYDFVAGTCFAIKSKCLEPLKIMHFENELFEQVSPARGMSFAHFLERYICISIAQQNYTLYGNDVSLIRNHLLKLPSLFLNRFSSERILEEPLDIDSEWFYWQMDNQLVIYNYSTVSFNEMRLKYEGKVIKLTEGIPYRYLQGDTKDYDLYCQNHKKYGLPIMSKERFRKLQTSIEENGFDNRKIVILDEDNVILDGQHRACIMCLKNGENSAMTVLRIIKLKRIIKRMLPKFIVDEYYKRQYGITQINDK